jgi:meso-butanediol dehydrogenase/(S,S)-butanediol dehydrogenase/diacetyl reductase
MTRRINLTGQRVLITGTGDIACTMAAWGAQVAATDRELSGAEVTLERIKQAGGSGCAVALDVTDEQSVDAGVAACWDHLGGIDLLLNNAGVLTVSNVSEMTLKDWNFVMAVNITGVFLMSRAVAPRMVAQGTPASIVSTGSISGKRGDPGLAHYTASKFGVVGFTQALAQELAEHDILVNAVCPGVVDTPMIRALARDAGKDVEAYVSDQSIKRLQTPEDIAYAMAYLHTSRAMTGQAINIDGGTYFH